MGCLAGVATHVTCDTMNPMPLSNITMGEIEAADQAGIKLEITEGLPTWEFHPTLNHQLAVQSVFQSIQVSEGGSQCMCLPVLDVLIRFPDGSLKRPDLSIFCQMPAERDEAVTSIPVAVVEVVSAGSGIKDLKLNPPFYLKQGILDIVVIDPLSKEGVWFTADGRTTIELPKRLNLQCGCSIEV